MRSPSAIVSKSKKARFLMLVTSWKIKKLWLGKSPWRNSRAVDGYRFGGQNVYCLWDVINFCDDLRASERTKPKAYWINSSGNDVVRKLIDKSSTATTRRDIERLIEGEAHGQAGGCRDPWQSNRKACWQAHTHSFVGQAPCDHQCKIISLIFKRINNYGKAE